MSRLILVGGPPGSGKTHFCREIVFHPSIPALTMMCFYEERNTIRHSMMEAKGITNPSALPKKAYMKIAKEADELYFDQLQKTLKTQSHNFIIVEYPFHKMEDLCDMLKLAQQHDTEVSLHLLFAGDVENVLNLDLARRFQSKEQVEEAIQSGAVDDAVRQSLQLQKVYPHILEECVALGIEIDLWDNSGEKLPGYQATRIAKAVNGKLWVSDAPVLKKAYEQFQQNANINPDMGYSVTISEEPFNLHVNLGKGRGEVVYKPTFAERYPVTSRIRDIMPPRTR